MKKTMILLLVLSLIFTLFSACTKNDDTQTTTTMTTTTRTTTATTTTQAQTTQTEKVLSFPLDEMITLDILANANTAMKRTDYNEFQVFKDLEAKTNVHINWQVVFEGEQFLQRKNLAIASGNLPDAIYGAWAMSPSEVIKFGAQEVLIPLDELIDQYASYLKDVFEKRPELRQKLATPEGKIYSLAHLHESPYINIPSAMVINKKWLDKLNLNMPKTTDEFRDVLKAFKDNDANENGDANDEIPFTYLGNSTHHIYNQYVFSGIFGKVNVPTLNYLHITDGKVEFVPVTQEHKEYLAYLNMLYQEGLIDPEVYTQDRSAFNSKILNIENPIVGVAPVWSINWLTGKMEEDADYVYLPLIKSPNGPEPETYLWEQNHSLGAFAITSANEYPEITMMWIDQVYEPMTSFEMTQGPENVTFRKNASGKYEMISPPEGISANDFRHDNAPGTNAVYAVLIDFAQQFELSPHDLSKLRATEPYIDNMPDEIYRSMMMSEEDSEIVSEFSSLVNDLYNNWQARFVMNGGIEQSWDEYVNTFKQINLDQVIDIYQKYYDIYASAR